MVSSQDFLLTNVGLAVGLTVFFWYSRPRLRVPARLRLRSSVTTPRSPVTADELAHRRKARESMASVRPLNVQFIFNGHNFDAHEVLGIPAGCNKKQVEEAYMNSLRGMQEVDRAFIENAYQAIIQKLSS